MSFRGPENEPLEYADLLEQLGSRGLKLTPTRKAVLRSLTGHHELLTIDELVERCNEHDAKIHHYVTVYRCLQKLEEAGLVHSTNFGDGLTRYELSTHSHHHHHILCTRCREIEPLDSCSVSNLEETIRKMGYKKITHRLEFFGTCPRCVEAGP